jgi:heterodisulfide reductase subunit C
VVLRHLPGLFGPLSPGVDIAGIMLSLRREGLRQGWVKLEKDLSFYKAFLLMVEERGRIWELSLGLKTALRRLRLHPQEDAFLLYRMWRKGKIR